MTRTGIDVVIPVTELPDEPGHIAAPALIDALWHRWVHIHMGNRLRRAPYTPIFSGGYINAQATGALATGAWTFKDGALHLRFDDAQGLLRVHALAAAHFTTLSMALLSLDENFSRSMRFAGWSFPPHSDPMSLMDAVDTPLIELRNALYVIEGPASSPALISPHKLQHLSMSDLDSAERAAVMDAIERRSCQCQLCEYYRPRAQKLVETAAKRAAKADAATKKTATKKTATKKTAT